MPKMIILLKEGYFKTHDCEPEFRLNFLNGIIGGWPECALRSKNLKFIGSGIEDTFADNDTVDMWCDSEGYMKSLPFTFSRFTDGHPLLGPVVICIRREYVGKDGEPDFKLMPFSEELTQKLLYYLRASDWIQVVYNEMIGEDLVIVNTDGEVPN